MAGEKSGSICDFVGLGLFLHLIDKDAWRNFAQKLVQLNRSQLSVFRLPCDETKKYPRQTNEVVWLLNRLCCSGWR
jgi:hypothetical protein